MPNTMLETACLYNVLFLKYVKLQNKYKILIPDQFWNFPLIFSNFDLIPKTIM